MKKTLLAILAAVALAAPITGITAPASAQEMKVGTIDVQQILAKSPLMKALEAAQKQVAEAEQGLVTFRNDKLKELQEMQKRVQEGSMKEDDFIKKQRELEDELRKRVEAEQNKLAGKKEEIGKMKVKLEKDVETAVNKVAKEKGLDMVINKQLVIFGGTDITNDVIKNIPNS